MPEWALIEPDEDNRPMHVVPINDLVDHEDSEHCWCAPKVLDTCNGKMVTHNSADGREDFEQGHWSTHRVKPRWRDS